MSDDIEKHVQKKYEIVSKLGKGVSQGVEARHINRMLAPGSRIVVLRGTFAIPVYRPCFSLSR